MSAKMEGLREDMLLSKWDANLEKGRWASLPQLPKVSTTKGMQDHPNSWHLGEKLAGLCCHICCIGHDSLKMAGQSGDVI